MSKWRGVEERVLRQCEMVERVMHAYYYHHLHIDDHIRALRRYLLSAGTATIKEFVVHLREGEY